MEQDARTMIRLVALIAAKGDKDEALRLIEWAKGPDDVIPTQETLVKVERSAPVPYKEIVDLWNATTEKPKVCSLTEQRKRGMKLRYDELAKSGRDPMDALRTIFQKIRDNKFLREGNWCSFDWVFKNSNNLIKILEGNYDDKGKDNVNDFWDGRD